MSNVLTLDQFKIQWQDAISKGKTTETLVSAYLRYIKLLEKENSKTFENWKLDFKEGYTHKSFIQYLSDHLDYIPKRKKYFANLPDRHKDGYYTEYNQNKPKKHPEIGWYCLRNLHTKCKYKICPCKCHTILQ